MCGLVSTLRNYVAQSVHQTGSAHGDGFGTNRGERWVSHKRNVQSDLKDLFGQDITSIDAVPLMTDTNNSGGHARVYYGDIWFSFDRAF